MPAPSRPVVYGLLTVLTIATVVWSNQEPPASTPKKKRAAVKKVEQTNTEYTLEDYQAHFEAAKPVSRNLFDPVVKPPVVSTPASMPTTIAPPKDIDKIPADLAGGEATWIMTGFATVNGQNMALLENTGTKQGGFVKEGETWKTTRVLRISPQSVVLAKKDGTEQVVLRFDPNKPPEPKAPGTVSPLDPSSALRGPIGPPPGGMPGSFPGGMPGGMQIRPMPGGGTMIISN